jgi:hypothetical protein
MILMKIVAEVSKDQIGPANYFQLLEKILYRRTDVRKVPVPKTADKHVLPSGAPQEQRRAPARLLFSFPLCTENDP